MKLKHLPILSALIVVPFAYADFYKVTVKRVDKDLYKDIYNGVYIQTRYCYEYAYSEEAILNFEEYSYDNKIIFDSGETCEVEKVFK